MFLKEPIYKELVRIFSPNNLIYEKSTFKFKKVPIHSSAVLLSKYDLMGDET